VLSRIMPVAWHPCGLLNGQPATPYAVLILNQPINQNALNAVIQKASLLVCADAGADRLFHYDQLDTRKDLERRLPDAIVGDLDSLTPEVEEHYRARGVPIERDPDQYSTDFTKCLQWIRRYSVQHLHDAGLDVVVLGGLGGRVDQGFSQIHHLYMAMNNVSLLKGRIYLLSEQSLSFVLVNDHNIIHVEPGYFEENVGIIPVLGRAYISTKGLEWDVDQWPTEFGGQMSTSNHIRSETIEIQFHGPQPLFTMELARRLTAISD